MKKALLLVIASLMFSIEMSAQASGGQITRKRTNKTTFVTKKKTDANSTSGFGTYSTKTIPDRIISLDGIKFLMVGVKGGIFNMGIDNYESYERPVHKVAISSFLIGESEVTQQLWECVMGTNPSYRKSPTLPVERVSWDDCQKFIAVLNSKTGLSFRLPTEAEWEYAAKGGQLSRHFELWPGKDNGGPLVWSSYNSGRYTMTVKTKEPNELRLYDMCGNVWEWCSDFYGNYSAEKQTNPKGPSDGLGRVIRGGSVNEDFLVCRMTNRRYYEQNKSWIYLGLRLVLDIK